MYNLVIRGHDLSNISTPEQLAQQTKSVGIHNLQFALGASFPQLDSSANALNPGMGTYFKNLFAKHDIQIALLSCYSNLIHPDPTKREEILHKFETYLRDAHFFGASMVASETGSVLPNLGYTEDNFSDTVFADLVKVIERLVKTGEKHRTLVGIEAGLNHPLSSIQRTKQLLEAVDSDYLGIILDPTNLITVDTHESIVAIVEEAFQQYGAKICAFHLKDFMIQDGKIVPTSLGKGLIDYPAILKIIQQYKPYCYIVLEQTKNEDIRVAKELIANL